MILSGKGLWKKVLVVDLPFWPGTEASICFYLRKRYAEICLRITKKLPREKQFEHLPGDLLR